MTISVPSGFDINTDIAYDNFSLTTAVGNSINGASVNILVYQSPSLALAATWDIVSVVDVLSLVVLQNTVAGSTVRWLLNRGGADIVIFQSVPPVGAVTPYPLFPRIVLRPGEYLYANVISGGVGNCQVSASIDAAQIILNT